MSKFYDEVTRRFGRPHVDVFSATEYRVWVRSGWHVHDGAATGDPVGHGKTLEAASKALIAYCDRPQAEVVHGECDQACCNRYSASPKSKLATVAFWNFLKEVSEQVERMPHWKRGLPPCVEERCDLAAGHKGDHA